MNEQEKFAAAQRFEDETLDVLFESAAKVGCYTGASSAANGATFISAFSLLTWKIEDGSLSIQLTNLNGSSPKTDNHEPEVYEMVFVDNKWLWRDTTGVHWAIEPKTLAEIWNRKFVDHIQKHEKAFWAVNLSYEEWLDKAA